MKYSNDVRDLLWIEKYKPKTIDECVLPDRLSKFFNDIINRNDLQNMLFIGNAGIGKTTVAKIIASNLNCDLLFINASESGNIDTLRTDIRQFASTISLTGNKYKIILLDEADYLNAQSTMPALRAFIEEFYNSARFILTSNFANRIIDPIKSRCVVIDFNLNNDEKMQCVMALNKRLQHILTKEKVKFTKEDLAQIILRFFPDYRKIINELQRTCFDGELKIISLNKLDNSDIQEIFNFLKNKKFKAMVSWVNTTDISFPHLIRSLYDSIPNYVEQISYADFILILNDFDYRNSFVADTNINLISMFLTLMKSNISYL